MPAESEELSHPVVSARRRRRRALNKFPVYLCLIPALIFLVVFSYYPFFSAFYHSLFKWDGVNSTFVGFKHFVDLASDERLGPSVKNIFILTSAGVFFALTLPLIAAVFIHNLKSERMSTIYRFVFTMPLVIPWVVTVLVWQFLYDPLDGPINRFLIAVGYPEFVRAWLADPDIAIFAIALIGGGGTGVGFPFVAGLNLLVYLSGLNNISSEVKEAAILEGATSWQMFRNIELPLIRTQIRINLVMTIITQLQTFHTIILLTRGGPGYSTMVPGMAMYQDAFEFSRMGYASAIGVVLFVIMLVITLIANNRLRTTTDFDPN